MKKTQHFPQWKHLYEQALQIKKLAPWEWMNEDDYIGIEHPITQEIAFVSIMGAQKEHFALGIYLGVEELHCLLELKEHVENFAYQQLFEICQLQLSFENRNDITPEDYEQIKSLDFHFRGKNAWPMFRTMGNGFLPWYIEDPKELQYLSIILEQVLDVAPRFKKSPSLLPQYQTQQYLIRVQKKQGKSLVWKEEIRYLPPPEEPYLPVFLDFSLLNKVKKLPQTQQVVEIDCFLIPSSIFEEKDERPYFPYLLILVGAHSGIILSYEILQPQKEAQKFWRDLATAVAKHFEKGKNRPQKIRVRNKRIYHLLKPLAQGLQIDIEQDYSLPALDQAKAHMNNNFRDADF